MSISIVIKTLSIWENPCHILKQLRHRFARSYRRSLLTLWMLSNFLKIYYIVVCFLKPVNSAFFMGIDKTEKQTGWIPGQPPSCSAAGLKSNLFAAQSVISRKKKQNLQVLKSRRQCNLFLENYPAFKGLTSWFWPIRLDLTIEIIVSIVTSKPDWPESAG